VNGSDFVRDYARKGAYAWEAAAVELARQNQITPWPWIELPLRSASGDEAVLRVASDVVSVGSFEDHVRLPLMPPAAQSIANLSGALLPTPWLVYQTWRAAPVKLSPTPMAPNLYANLEQYAEHSRRIDIQIERYFGEHSPSAAEPADGRSPTEARGTPGLISGHKKDVVVSNIYRPGKVLIFGWYRLAPPHPDVFDDGQPVQDPDRQPIQPRSNIHGADYVDYSHGIRLIAPTAIVNGQTMDTEALYRHPTLSALVSNEGPLRTPRYPAPVRPPKTEFAMSPVPDPGFYVVPSYPSEFEHGVVFAGRGPLRGRRRW
jgi:hypothetical protein